MLREYLDKNRALPWQIGNDTVPVASMPLVMGIVNVTPDSFFDGGKHNKPDAAYEHAVTLLQQKAAAREANPSANRKNWTAYAPSWKPWPSCP